MALQEDLVLLGLRVSEGNQASLVHAGTLENQVIRGDRDHREVMAQREIKEIGVLRE